jgi:hypothetical protein
MRPSSIRSFLAGGLVVGAIALASGGTYSAFTSTTSNAGDSFSAGTVTITDDDAGVVMFNVSGMRPADAARTRCIKVTYTGSLDAAVRVYASASSGGLEPYLNLTVESGTSSAGFAGCAGFSGSTIYSGTLSAFPTTFAAGIADGGTWTTSSARAYRFTVSVQNNAAAQGRTGTATFTWEARNV